MEFFGGMLLLLQIIIPVMVIIWGIKLLKNQINIINELQKISILLENNKKNHI